MHKKDVENMKTRLASMIAEATGVDAEINEEAREAFGHYTTPVALRLAKEREENPKVLALELLNKIEEAAPRGFFERIEIAGPGFINMWLSERVVQEEFKRISELPDFGENKLSEGKKAVIEFSSPNMAKEMHAGHLRNNALGEAIARLHSANGYEVVRWNYIGDWGTQFGKILAAYKLWGGEEELGDEPIKKLEELYIRFNKAAKDDPELEARGREEFKKLEEGDAENRELWNNFRTASLKEIEGIYREFNIRFDEYIGESFFEERMKPLVKELLSKNIAEMSEGAVVVRLDDLGLPPALIAKSDGSSLYLTRDIAALEYRVKNYHPNRLFYVVGNEQTLQFQQLFAIAGLMGLDHGVDLRHIKYGLLLGKDGAKMSTREGTSISVTDLKKEAVQRAKKIVDEKNPGLREAEREHVAEVVGINALKYFMLSENRMSDIIFDWDKILDFKGDSGPYLQYTYARLKRVVSKAGDIGSPDISELKKESELRLMRKLFAFPEEVKNSIEFIVTNNLTTYLFELANAANRFYEDEPILTDKNAGRRAARLRLTETAAHILKKGLDLLGIEVLESI